MATVGWLGTELGVGEVAKDLRFILSGQLHRDQPTALCFALHRSEGAGFLLRVLCSPGNLSQGGWKRHHWPETDTHWRFGRGE